MSLQLCCFSLFILLPVQGMGTITCPDLPTTNQHGKHIMLVMVASYILYAPARAWLLVAPLHVGFPGVQASNVPC